MAGAGWRSFSDGSVLTAAQVQQYLQDQAVQVYASAAARSSALGTAVSNGMVSYRTDSQVLETYISGAWVGMLTTAGTAADTAKLNGRVTTKSGKPSGSARCTNELAIRRPLWRTLGSIPTTVKKYWQGKLHFHWSKAFARSLSLRPAPTPCNPNCLAACKTRNGWKDSLG